MDWLYETDANHQSALPIFVSDEEVKDALTIMVCFLFGDLVTIF